MLKLVFRLTILSVLVLAASILIRRCIYRPLQLLPYSYGADLIHLKSSFFNKYHDRYNTVFIGSSHVFRQFETILFDSLTGNGTTTRSFNYGIQGLAAAEQFYLCDHLINKDISLKYLLIELACIPFPSQVNLHSTRMFYWYNRKNFSFTVRAIFDSKGVSFPRKIAMSSMHTIGYLDKELNFSYFKNLNDFYKMDMDINNQVKILSNHYTGFVPRPGLIIKPRYINGVNVRRKASAEQFQKFEDHPELLNSYNKEYLAKINETILKFEKRGIHTIFVFAPRAEKSNYDEIIPLLYQIDGKHKINLADSRKYPDFYSLENSADETHLNVKGAAAFTTALAKEFNQLIVDDLK